MDHKEEVLAVLLERYAVFSGAAVGDNPAGQSHANLGVMGPIRQGSLTALSKASLAPSTDSKGPAARPTAGDVKRLGSSRGRLDIKVACPLLRTGLDCLLTDCSYLSMLSKATGSLLEWAAPIMPIRVWSFAACCVSDGC